MSCFICELPADFDKTKPTVSIGQSPPMTLEDVKDMEEAIDCVTLVLGSVRLADVTGLDEVRRTVVQLSGKKAALLDYKRKHPGLRLYQVCIISLVRSHLLYHVS